MDATAIRQIQDETAKHDALDQFDTGLGVRPAALIPDGFSLKEIGEYMPAPLHFRGEYKTNHMRSFVHYSESHKQPDSACFIHPSRFFAKTIFTVGTQAEPAHRFHTAQLTLNMTEPYKALTDAIDSGSGKNQQDFAFWLQDWEPHINCRDTDDEDIDFKSALKAIQQIKVDEQTQTDNRVQHFAAERSTLEKIGVTSEHALPAYIDFTCQPYKELQLRVFRLRVQVVRTSNGVTLTLKAIGLEQTHEEMREEFQLLLEADIKQHGIDVLIGEFSG